ncbi:MAG: signal peptidase I [Patescibacteria group bacterium]|nr:signal peptidase I [Patescibacteria group bacterium]
MDELKQNPQPAANGGGIKAVAGFFWDLLKILIIALVIIVPFRIFVAEPFVVSGSSMLPNFHNGDYLIIDRLSYRFSQPDRGDVIVLLFPKDTSQFFIKRIIGLPGETVQIKQGHVYIFNQQHPEGFELNESYIPSGVMTYDQPDKKVTLGDNEYFVLGDNRLASSDSRVWGILPRNDIVGRVFLRVFPVASASVFHPVNYQ